MKTPNPETFCPENQEDWRKWLESNHSSKDSVWLIMYKKDSATPNITWSEAVDVALCYGWIDSIRRGIDGEKFKHYYSKRKPVSTWSKINRAKIEKLIADGLMHEAGFKSIEIAKQNGSWEILDEVEEYSIPVALEDEFNQRPGSIDYFLSLSKSVQKQLLAWIALAKRPETKQKRIEEVASCAANKKKPKQFG